MGNNVGVNRRDADQLKLRYIALDQVVLWDENPKKHDVAKLKNSIMMHGFVDPPKFDPNLNGGKGGLVYGNGRSICVKMIMDETPDHVPRGIKVDKEKHWYLPVIFGVDAASEETATALAIDHNNLTMLGGDFGPFDVAKMWNVGEYMAMMEKLNVSEGGIKLASVAPAEFDQMMNSLRVSIDGIRFDESIADGVMPEVTFRIRVAVEKADDFQAELDEFLKGHEYAVKVRRSDL